MDEVIAALIDYFKKLQRAVNNADLTILKYKLVKKTKIDDLIVCTLTKLPDSFKKAMKKRLKMDVYPSVSCYIRLSKIIKKPFALNKDFYIINYNDVNIMLKTIMQNLERDIKTLEQEEG